MIHPMLYPPHFVAFGHDTTKPPSWLRVTVDGMTRSRIGWMPAYMTLRVDPAHLHKLKTSIHGWSSVTFKVHHKG